jgi:AcrR family transcriptional regulator
MVHLMAREVSSQAPGTGTVAETRDRILDAVVALITEEHPATVSVPAVARRAGVSVATVYRYFPTKEQLLDGATEIGHRRTSTVLDESRRRIGLAPESGPDERDALIERVVGQLFAEFTEHLDYVRGAGASPVGRDLRRRRRADKQRELRALLAALDLDPDGPPGRRLATMIELLASSTVFVELHDHLDLSTAEATAHVAWTIRTLLEATR